MRCLCLALALSLSLVACSESPTDDPDTTSSGVYDSSKPCGEPNKCPSGQFCWNGLCVVGCNTNQECAADQFCDTFWKQCANKTVSTCPEVPCAASQTCVNSVCTAKDQPKQTCDPDSFADGCANDAFCLRESEAADPSCFTMQRCGADGSCPVGLEGAVCNESYVSGKGRICLPGGCRTAAHCPNSWACVRFDANQVLGFCSSGGLHALCAEKEDCQGSFSCPVDPVSQMGTCSNGAFGSQCSSKADCQPGLDCFGAMPGTALGSCAPEM
ncbi:MAG: hypothetical protein HY901_18770 [Deltaproteobacteria bacterium]|nr:hypothetical protein [Deltaproteobacteria bacterium]